MTANTKAQQNESASEQGAVEPMPDNRHECSGCPTDRPANDLIPSVEDSGAVPESRLPVPEGRMDTAIGREAESLREETEDEAGLSLPSEASEARPNGRFPIVGIGASAGGLEALEAFLQAVPADGGLAYVLVSHLDPAHSSNLTEILQRCAVIPVLEAQDLLQVSPNHVYVIPPNRDMAVFHGVLHLTVPTEPRGQRMPIDAFLRSLAEDQGERSIGIVLSGTGTDGTLGLRAILGAGGIALVQDPATARYDGMPGSAIRSGYVSKVLAPEHMPAVLQRGVSGRLHAQCDSAEPTLTPALQAGISRILLLLRSVTGHDFSQYKKSTIRRRIERRMTEHNLNSIDLYARYLREHPPEVDMLFKELLINVTSFFRDPEAFDCIKQEVLPSLFANMPLDSAFRVWVAGCATGEEAYSMAILLREYLDEIDPEHKSGVKLQIYATDLDQDAITIARAGVYPVNIEQDMTPDRLRRYFVKEGASYRVKKEIREMLVFAVQNVIKDPPFTRLNLLCCRNLMIYLEPDLQHTLLPSFHYALKPDGVLFLSPSESIGNHPDLFVVISRKWKLYRARHSATSAPDLSADILNWSVAVEKHDEKMPESAMKKSSVPSFAELTENMLLQSYAPASVVIDGKGNIQFVYGDTGKYLRPAPGNATLNLVDMAREGLQLDLHTALQVAVTQNLPTLNREVRVKTNGDFQRVNLSVRALSDSVNPLGLYLVSFQDMQTPTAQKVKPQAGRISGAAAARQVVELEHDLARTKESLQATIEAQQASNEELKSTNEELQSTNEELQSSNEELETSKEELQSLNEELVTVNAELQAKIEQLAGMQNDMKNLFDNISVGTIFLDDRLVIRRYSREATKLYRLVATDVGRKLADIKTDLLDDGLIAEAMAVRKSLISVEHAVQTRSGQWYLARIQPYRTLDQIIDGLVLTFTDITSRVAAEAAVQAQRELAEGIVNTLREPLLVLDEAGKVVTASRAFYQTFQILPEATLGRSIFDLGDRQWNIPAMHDLLDTVIRRGENFDGFVVEHEFPGIGHRKMLFNARRIIGAQLLVLLAMELAPF